jgi:hypothetical protein
LVDEIRTSDDYLMSLRDTVDIFEVEYSIKRKLPDRLLGFFNTLRRAPLVAGSDNPAATHLI